MGGIRAEIPSAHDGAERFRGAEIGEPPVDVLDERVRAEHIAFVADRKTHDHRPQAEKKLRSGIAAGLEVAQEGLNPRVVLFRNHVFREGARLWG